MCLIKTSVAGILNSGTNIFLTESIMQELFGVFSLVFFVCLFSKLQSKKLLSVLISFWQNLKM